MKNRRRPVGCDDTLIHAVAKGDTLAFTELMRRHRRWVMRTLVLFTHNTEEAEDLTQEVFTRLFRHAGSYRVRGGFIAWLKRITLNVGSSHLQQREPRALVPLCTLDEVPATADLTDPLRFVLSSSLETAIYHAIEELPPEQRDAVILRCFVSLTVPEIAKRQHCPEGTVKSRLSHGLRRVREALAETWGPDSTPC